MLRARGARGLRREAGRAGTGDGDSRRAYAVVHGGLDKHAGCGEGIEGWEGGTAELVPEVCGGVRSNNVKGEHRMRIQRQRIRELEVIAALGPTSTARWRALDSAFAGVY